MRYLPIESKNTFKDFVLGKIKSYEGKLIKIADKHGNPD